MGFRRLSQSHSKANKTKISNMVWQQLFVKHDKMNTWPGVKDKNDKLITLVDITSINFIRPAYSNKAKNAYITEDREILDQVNLRSKTRFNHEVLVRWNGCCGLCRKRLDINPIPFELHHICPKRFGGKDIPNNLVPLCKAPCHKKVSSAIQSRNILDIREYTKLGILDVPDEYINLSPSPK